MGQNLSTSTYILRILGGGYLVYLGLSLIEGIITNTGVFRLIKLIFAGLFCIVGVVLCVISFKKLREINRMETSEIEKNNGEVVRNPRS